MTAPGTPAAGLPQFLTVDEVAGALRVSRATVYRLVSSGALAANRVGKSVRVTRPAVEEFLRRHARPATDTAATGPGDDQPAATV